MGFIIFTIVLGIAFLVSVGFAFITVGGRIAAGVVVALWLLVFGIFSAATVPARSVGIETGFGKYKNTLDNGFHWTNPTSSVEKFSTQVQTLKLEGNGDNSDTVTFASPVSVTYKGGGQGQISATVSWKISDKQAKALWERYKSFDNVAQNLVKSGSENAIRNEVIKYIPTDAQGKGPEISAGVKAAIASEFAQYGVDVDSVRITNVGLDEKTQQSIEKVVIAQQDLARAELERQKAITEAKTAKIREQSGILSEQANKRYCLDVTNNWDQNKNGQLPAGWNCSGSNVGLVAPSK